ncbi:uncharacterized protein LY89DRAFT_714223 [Mollisia scopiformis]|uniref:Extracellular serine-rich protein n=1 Tax=Mollisia scopiformis TaxID=149040 RepID=A0A194XRR1_MOLSC|nr:uncharacterized protein LY89DRAFT_714223 [Mollisia scopiformis]KUJ22417.1 hypothetical protein LY89DRAFT_714223 [Mollisia scopiformis]
MHFPTEFLFLIAPLFVEAQGTPSSTSTAPVATQSIQVGAEGLSFTPPTVTANVGDIVEFRFYPQNHSVARADFETPCIPYEDTGPGRVGFWSGFQPIAVVLSNPPTFQVVINDTEPILFYCSAPGACINDGMVGVINPNSTETFAIQQAYAKNSTLMFSPGQYFPAETLSTTATTATATSSSTASSTAKPTSTSLPVASSSPSLSGGAIAGIAIGAFSVLVIGAALIYLCGRQRTMGEIIRNSHYPPPPPPTYQGHMSMTSTIYQPKGPNMEVDALGFRTFSGSQNPYDRSPVDEESYQPRSPHEDTGLGGAASPDLDSPLIGRPIPLSPGRDAMSPMTPIGDRYQSIVSDIPPPLRLTVPEPEGPHELSVESDRHYLPYKSPEFTDQRPI